VASKIWDKTELA